MIGENMGQALTTLKDFFGEGLWPLIAAASLICVLVFSSRRRRRYLLFAVLIFILFVYNNLTRKLLGRFVSTDVFYRFLWLAPLTVVIASAVTMLVRKAERPALRAAIVGAAVVLFILSGPNYISKETLKLPDNRYLLADDVLVISDAIGTDSADSGRYRAVMSDLLTRQMRCYDASYETVVRREDFRAMAKVDWSGELTDRQRLLGLAELGRAEDPALMMDSLQAENASYVVLNKSWELDTYMAQCGCRAIASSDNYTVYRVELPGVTSAA